MRAAPGCILRDLDFVLRRIFFHIFRIDRNIRIQLFFKIMQAIRQRHVPKPMMMAVGLAISRDMHQARMIVLFGKGVGQTMGKGFPILE